MKDTDSVLKNLLFRQAKPGEILNLRACELRSGKPVESASFPEDSSDETWHFGAFLDTKPLSCLTFIPRGTPEIREWQLRGMATASMWQRRGIGRKLLQFAEQQILQKTGPARIWCNARTHVACFYMSEGYRVISDEFDLPDIGPHFKMEKHLR